ncbi:MAG TPA: hypothetical protein V6C76_12970 [Drouetiella sp.]
MTEFKSTEVAQVADVAGHSYEEARAIMVPLVSESLFTKILKPNEKVNYVAPAAIEKMVMELFKEQFFNYLLFVSATILLTFSHLPLNQAGTITVLALILPAIGSVWQDKLFKKTWDKTFFLITDERAIAVTHSVATHEHVVSEVALAHLKSAKIFERPTGLVNVQLNFDRKGQKVSLNFDGLPDDDWAAYLKPRLPITRRKLSPGRSMIFKTAEVILKCIGFH